MIGRSWPANHIVLVSQNKGSDQWSVQHQCTVHCTLQCSVQCSAVQCSAQCTLECSVMWAMIHIRTMISDRATGHATIRTVYLQWQPVTSLYTSSDTAGHLSNCTDQLILSHWSPKFINIRGVSWVLIYLYYKENIQIINRPGVAGLFFKHLCH